jgi:hypothetical protein
MIQLDQLAKTNHLLRPSSFPNDHIAFGKLSQGAKQFKEYQARS